jgi:prephenate dehydratase
MAEALVGLRRVCQDVVFLGSYPRADDRPQSVPRGGTDDDYAAAHAWLAGLRA